MQDNTKTLRWSEVLERGPKIPLSETGKLPDWLADDDMIAYAVDIHPDKWEPASEGLMHLLSELEDQDDFQKNRITAFCLQSDHPYYRCQELGFVYIPNEFHESQGPWESDDYIEVLFGDGRIDGDRDPNNWWWARDETITLDGGDIIGYRHAVDPEDVVVEEKKEFDSRAIYRVPAYELNSFVKAYEDLLKATQSHTIHSYAIREEWNRAEEKLKAFKAVRINDHPSD